MDGARILSSSFRKAYEIKRTPKCIDAPLCVFQDEFLFSIRYLHQQIMEHLTGARTRGHA